MSWIKKFPFLFILSFCLLIGLAAGSTFGLVTGAVQTQERAGVQPGQEESVATVLPNGQQNLLVIGVDRLDTQTHRLESVWLVLYSPAAPSLTMLPLFPASLEGGPASDEFLEKNFSLDERGSLAEDFKTALKSKDLWWSNYAVIDEAGLAELIDLVGGARENNEAVSGIRAVADVTPPWENRQTALRDQSRILEQLCQVSNKPSIAAQPAHILELFNNHLITDLAPELVISIWQDIRSSGNRLCKIIAQQYSFDP
jgi:hypothetical protein